MAEYALEIGRGAAAVAALEAADAQVLGDRERGEHVAAFRTNDTPKPGDCFPAACPPGRVPAA